MMFIVTCAKIYDDVKSIKLEANSLRLIGSRAEAQKEAEGLAFKHKKPYYVLNLLSESNFKTSVTTVKL